MPPHRRAVLQLLAQNSVVTKFGTVPEVIITLPEPLAIPTVDARHKTA
jgi:hypothetical protein